MDRWLIEQAWPVRYRAAFGVVGAVIKPRDPCMGYRAGAHRAGFQRYPQVATYQSVVAQKRRSLPHRYDFGVSGWVVAADRAVGSLTDDPPVLHHQRPDRHFASRRRASCKDKRCFHHFAGFG